MRSRAWLWLPLVAAAALLLPLLAAGPSDAGATPAGDGHHSLAGESTGKLESSLAEVAARSAAPPTFADGRARQRGGITADSIVVSVLTSGEGSPSSAIRAVGGEILSARDGILIIELHAGRLFDLASDRSVEFISALPRPVSEGLFGEGVVGQGASAWHAAGFDGSGIRVLVVDTGFQGLSTAQALGHLPQKVGTGVGPTCGAGGSIAGPDPSDSHGTAVAEIVYGMAPGADLFLYRTCSPFDDVDLVSFVEKHGIHVVNQSLAYFNTVPLDGSDPLGLWWFIDEIVEEGTLWFNSAGNYRQRHWRGPWSGVGALDFALGTSYIEMSLPAEASVFLRWDDWRLPVRGWCGRGGACGSDLDFDLLLFDSNWELVDQSDIVQSPNRPWMPIEAVTAPSAGLYRIRVIDKTEPGTPKPPGMNFDLFVPWADLPFDLRVHDGSLNDTSTLSSVTSVGAVSCANGQIRQYSSQGPTADGRVKPDLSAFDGVTTLTFGPGCPIGFQGTSASAPHAAGAAALIMHASGARGDEVVALLARRSIPGPAGEENRYGAGSISLANVPSGRCGGRDATIIALPGQVVVHGTDGDDVIRGNGRDNIIYGYGGDDWICGGPGDDVIHGGPGNDRIWGGRGNDTIRGGPGNDRIWGGPGNDTLYGGSGHDRIRGGRGNDTIFGGRGNDRIWGGPGTNTIDGGPGTDRCRQASVMTRCEV